MLEQAFASTHHIRRPNPNAQGMLSSFSVPSERKNRSGMNISGSGYLFSSCDIALPYHRHRTHTRERTLLPEISQDHRTCTERSAKNSVNTNAAHLVECNTLDRHRLRSWHEGLEHVSGSRNPTPGLNTPIGATGCHLIVSRNTASTYGNDARSSKSGSRCRPTTRSISACARCWTSGWFIMR